jgi:hypothetical protein
MQGNSTTLSRPAKLRTGNENEDNKQFSFDYSYWSHSPSDSHFADQQRVFDDLGAEVLKNAWEGIALYLFEL